MTGPWDRSPEPILARISFRVTQADAVDASRAFLRQRYFRAASFQVPVLIGFAASVLAASYAPSAPPWALALPVAAVLGLTALIRLVEYLLVPRIVRRVFAGRNAMFGSEWVVSLTRSGVRAGNAVTETFNVWDNVLSRRDYERTVVVSMRTGTSHFIPRSAVTPAFAETFRTLSAGQPKP